jgi:hypothetical protein
VREQRLRQLAFDQTKCAMVLKTTFRYHGASDTYTVSAEVLNGEGEKLMHRTTIFKGAEAGGEASEFVAGLAVAFEMGDSGAIDRWWDKKRGQRQ